MLYVSLLVAGKSFVFKFNLSRVLLDIRVTKFFVRLWNYDNFYILL